MAATTEEVLTPVPQIVAHRVERKTTPLAAFLLGAAAGRGMAGGASRVDALTAVLETLESVLPPPGEESRYEG